MKVENVELEYVRVEKLEGQDKPDWGEHEYNIVYRAKELDFLYDSPFLEKFNNLLEDERPEIKLTFSGEIFEEGEKAFIHEYFIDKYDEISKSEDIVKNGIDILMGDSENAIEKVLAVLNE